MRQEKSADIAIVGGGIVGLAHAYHALKKGYRVVLFEREHFAVGASIRNFGMVWPIGQQPGEGLNRALRARQHWLEVSSQAGFWINPSGSLHVAFHQDEMDVLQEFEATYPSAPYRTKILSPDEVLEKSPALKKEGLKGGLWSETECVINPREAVRRIPLWLQEKFGLVLRFGNVVTEIAMPSIRTAREEWKVDQVFVCNGADFETLYPDEFNQQHITKCKLQMMKAVPSHAGFSIGPSLCAGLTLRHYAAFAKCPSLKKVDARFDQELLAYKTHGIHVLLSQNNHGELIIGDSHHYYSTIEPFDRVEIDQIILDYLNSFTNMGDYRIIEHWHGVYPKIQGQLNMLVKPESGVTIVNGLGGAGMTLSFGLAEEIIDNL